MKVDLTTRQINALIDGATEAVVLLKRSGTLEGTHAGVPRADGRKWRALINAVEKLIEARNEQEKVAKR